MQRIECKPKSKIKHIDWGDDHTVKIKQPNLNHIPGSLICPMPCHPVGDVPEKWDKRPLRKNQIPKKNS